MPTPEARVAASRPNDRTPIAEIVMLVYSMEPGQTEVQIQYPPDAHAGGGISAAAASSARAQFRRLALAELDSSLGTFQ